MTLRMHMRDPYFAPLGELHVGAGAHFGPLSVFPVWTSAAGARKFVTATVSDVFVAELPEPSVSEVFVSHKQAVDMLLPEGMLLVGGWQTRAVVRDVIVAPGEPMVVAVRCVERGRWGGGQYHGVDGIAPMSVRAALRKPDADQGIVWDRVTRLEGTFGPRATSSLHDLMAESIGGPLREPSAAAQRPVVAQAAPGIDAIDTFLLDEVRDYARHPLPGQRGVVIGIAGEALCLELYGSVAALKAELPTLLTASLIDAWSASNRLTRTPGWRARQLAARCQEMRWLNRESTAEASATTEHCVAWEGPLELRATRRPGSPSVLHASLLNTQHELALAL